MNTKTAAARPTVHRARIPADALTVLVAQTLVLLGIWVCAVVVSFTGLVAAAGWANVNEGQRVFVPLFIDGVLIGGSLAYLVAKERRDRASQAIAIVAMIVFAGLSIAGNGVHALAGATAGVQRVTGVLIAVAAPIAILVTTELLARTVIASPDEHVPAPSTRAARHAAKTPTAPTAPALTPAPTTTTETPALPVAARPAPVRDGADERDGRSLTAEERASLKAHARALAAHPDWSRQRIADLLGLSKGTVVSWCSGISTDPDAVLPEGVFAGRAIGATT